MLRWSRQAAELSISSTFLVPPSTPLLDAGLPVHGGSGRFSKKMGDYRVSASSFRPCPERGFSRMAHHNNEDLVETDSSKNRGPIMHISNMRVAALHVKMP